MAVQTSVTNSESLQFIAFKHSKVVFLEMIFCVQDQQNIYSRRQNNNIFIFFFKFSLF